MILRLGAALLYLHWLCCCCRADDRQRDDGMKGKKATRKPPPPLPPATPIHKRRAGLRSGTAAAAAHEVPASAVEAVSLAVPPAAADADTSSPCVDAVAEAIPPDNAVVETVEEAVLVCRGRRQRCSSACDAVLSFLSLPFPCC